ncbi:cardioacceleratory peptide receptor-like [Limulus polyphemus]|uniref:Cardioacceleratory peptide receptor-like n=1 Tax=Limulus polyphemus TaxID=6850 RepID=A0ABM1B7L9_LIMPO|nr:cardioacceleratory peptide receptor-like [Limulus polyphemus]
MECDMPDCLPVSAASVYEDLSYNETQNLTKNVSQNDELKIYHFYQTEQLTFLWILFVMIVLGNGCVLVALLLSSNRKSRMNFFIMHLAIADMTVGLVSVLTDIVWRTTVEFHVGNIGCKIIKYLQILVTYSSTYVLVALSIDRYDAIINPMKFSGGWKRARILVISAWGLSAVASAPSLFLYNESKKSGKFQCWAELQPWQWKIYFTLVAISVFFLPAVIISICYTVIVWTIWTKSGPITYSKQKRTTFLSKANTMKLRTTISVEENRRISSRGIIPKAKVKTIKMTIVIVLVFILCWSPYFVYDLLQVFGYIRHNQTTIAISTFVQSLAPLNSAANPIIYCFFTTTLYRNLRKLPFCNWLAKSVCFCFPSMQRPLRDATFFRTSENTMSESLTRSSRRNSGSHFSLKSNPSISTTPKRHIVDKNRTKTCILGTGQNQTCSDV